ncbi:MAG: shikimate dehydrogenase [Kangiellaceae bacterium]|nr:shikimate dehydrogenase [Kangiellaceae bacterium]
MNRPLRYAVVGNPISHSMSPKLHPQFAQQFGIDINYHKICPTKKGFYRVLNDFFSSGGKGLNITAPFKELAVEYADIITERARDANSVNTLVYSPDGIIGDSTDGIGFLRDLYNKQIFFQNKRAVLLGAGGVARCIASALLLDGFEVYIINRTQSKAHKLAEDLSHLGHIQIYDKQDHIDLVVNSVSKNGERFLSEIFFDLNATAYDLNYGDKAQTFIQAAQEFTTQQFDGLGMLIEQGAESFGLWTGKYPDTLKIHF